MTPGKYLGQLHSGRVGWGLGGGEGRSRQTVILVIRYPDYIGALSSPHASYF